jgi:hypothetical protein
LVPAGLGEAADAMVELCEMRGLKLNILRRNQYLIHNATVR